MSAVASRMGRMSDHDEPFWRVQTVYDPEGLGRDFAYTVGLAERGVPELHLWARPSLGEDPGADWNLSLLDAARMLNGVAWRLLDGDLPVGATWEHEYDAGFVTARFVVQDAVPAVEVEAFAAGDVPVLPVRWSLERDPVGPLVAMTPGAQKDAERLHHDVWQLLDDGLASTPAGWPEPVSLDWSAEQDFGPRTPLVLARAAQVWSAGQDALIDQASNAIILNQRRQPGYAVLVARAAARRAGRVEVLDRVSAAATRLMAELGEGWGVQALAALRHYMIGDMGDAPVEDREAVMRGIRSALTEQVQALLVTEAAADLMPAWAVVWGQGPTLTALGPQGLPPEDRYRCSPEVGEAVRSLVTGCIIDDVVRASVAWHETQGCEAELWLETIRITGATHAPHIADIVTPQVVSGIAQVLREDHDLPLLVCQEWLNALAAVLSERVSLDASVVEAFLASGPHVPGLAALVDEPLVMGGQGARR